MKSKKLDKARRNMLVAEREKSSEKKTKVVKARKTRLKKKKKIRKVIKQ